MQYTAVYCTDKLGIKLKLKIPRLMLKNFYQKYIFSFSSLLFCLYYDWLDTCGVEMEGKRQTEKNPAFFTIVTSMQLVAWLLHVVVFVLGTYMLKANEFPHGVTSASGIPTVTITFDWLDDENKVAISLEAATFTQPLLPTRDDIYGKGAKQSAYLVHETYKTI